MSLAIEIHATPGGRMHHSHSCKAPTRAAKESRFLRQEKSKIGLEQLIRKSFGFADNKNPSRMVEQAQIGPACNGLSQQHVN
jgi:hypothetical protein